MLKQLVLLGCALYAHADSVTACHTHGSTLFCIDADGTEGYMTPGPEGSVLPQSYTDCTTNGGSASCVTGGSTVRFVVEAAASVTSAASAASDAITACHFHGTTQFCLDAQGAEGYVSPNPTNTADAPASYTGCHSHGEGEIYCMEDDTNEVRFVVEASATSSSAASTGATSAAPTGQTTAVTACHFHGETQFCLNGDGGEGHMTPGPTNTGDAPASYTSCHAHETDIFCLDPEGNEVQFIEDEVVQSENSTEEMDCHFHAGVEHCIPKGGSENSSTEPVVCDRQDRDYNIPLRIGSIFAVLATSIIAAFLPIFIKKFFNTAMDGLIMMTLKQFGTGVIISTALVHLLTHAALMFNNQCLTTIHYEATTCAITMAGLFVSFLAEYICNRILLARQNQLTNALAANDAAGSEEDVKASSDDQVTEVHHDHHHGVIVHNKDKVTVWLLEAGIIFHSILVGVTLVVAGDSYYITLFIVIIFHQAFEGVALASRIADLEVRLWYKLLMALAFAITTPIGMAIGTGVISTFNGNDPSTIIALGTLDAFSAGILLWVGIIEMWSHDWLHGPLSNASWVMVSFSLFGLIAGMVLMSFLGKWA